MLPAENIRHYIIQRAHFVHIEAPVNGFHLNCAHLHMVRAHALLRFIISIETCWFALRDWQLMNWSRFDFFFFFYLFVTRIAKMFPYSSQKKYWIFSDENDLTTLREKTNADFIAKHGANMTVSLLLHNYLIGNVAFLNDTSACLFLCTCNFRDQISSMKI